MYIHIVYLHLLKDVVSKLHHECVVLDGRMLKINSELERM